MSFRPFPPAEVLQTEYLREQDAQIERERRSRNRWAPLTALALVLLSFLRLR